VELESDEAYLAHSDAELKVATELMELKVTDSQKAGSSHSTVAILTSTSVVAAFPHALSVTPPS